MKHWRSLLGLGLTLLACVLRAQEVRVRPAAEVTMPTPIDCNSPAFWREGRFHWFGGQGKPTLSMADSQAGPWDTQPVDVLTDRTGQTWIESAWCDDNGAVFAWYHTEPLGLVEGSALTAPQIGAMVSVDGGRTMLDLGIILRSGDAIDPTAQNGFFVGGHGDFSVILDRKREYFYFLFGNYGGPAETQGVSVARLAFADRFEPVGKVQKFFNGEWKEPGLDGRVSPIFPVNRSWQAKDPDAFWGPSLHWNTALNAYVMLLNHAQGEPGWSQEGVYVSFNADLSRPDLWSAPVKVLDRADLPGWQYFYPQVLGLQTGETDSQAGGVVRLFVYGSSRWEMEFVPPPEPVVPSDAAPASPPSSSSDFVDPDAGPRRSGRNPPRNG